MITEEDKEFLAHIKLHKRLGFGRMMQIISYEWYCSLERMVPGQGAGAHVAKTCVNFLSDEDYISYTALLEREKSEGMKY